jgi:hypothetical protein
MGTEKYTSRLSTDLSLLVDMERPESVFTEVQAVFLAVCPDRDLHKLRRVFDDTVRLYKGRYLGYRKCNTGYHDLKHATDMLLCTARLLHGLHIGGLPLNEEVAELCLISALLHDAGYIQGHDDFGGTGAKYAMVHVERSLIFLKNYFEGNGFSRGEYETCGRLIMATDLDANFKDIPFASEEEETAGKALFAGDILGQMADRLYLEKLLYLYREFAEARVMGLKGEDELLAKTLDFYKSIKRRLKEDIGYTDRYMRNHFKARWDIDRDMYMDAVEKNIDYLRHILRDGRASRKRLNRAGIVKKLKEKEK